MSAISQLLLTRFWQHFKGRLLVSTKTITTTTRTRRSTTTKTPTTTTTKHNNKHNNNNHNNKHNNNNHNKGNNQNNNNKKYKNNKNNKLTLMGFDTVEINLVLNTFSQDGSNTPNSSISNKCNPYGDGVKVKSSFSKCSRFPFPFSSWFLAGTHKSVVVSAPKFIWQLGLLPGDKITKLSIE